MELSVDRINSLAEEVEQLKAENERLKDCVTDLQNGNDSLYNALCKYKSCLQEIKAIVCGNYEIIDPQGRKDILKLIIKAEVE